MFDDSKNGVVLNSGQQRLSLHRLYRNAADKLLEHTFFCVNNADNIPLNSLYLASLGEEVVPILFLYRHSFELQMKMCLALLDELDGIKPKSRKRHELKTYWDDIHKRIPEHFSEQQSLELINPLSERLGYLYNNFKVLDQVDPKGFTFRYEDQENKPPKFELNYFKKNCKACADTLEELITGLSAFLDAQNCKK